MGITLRVISALNALNLSVRVMDDELHSIIQCSPQLFIHVVPSVTSAQPEEFVMLQEKYQQEGKLLVHLWEDVWLLNQTKVLSRIKSFLGLNQTIHGRKTKIIALNLNQITEFFNLYHLQGYIKAKYNYGLMINNEVVAAASFGVHRPMRSKGVNYYSSELIRFTSKDNLTVVGGLSKLVKHHCKQVKINDIMTYADRDWSLGKGYEQLGFELTTLTPPAYLYVDGKTRLRYFPHRLPKNVLSAFDEQKELNLDDYLAGQGFLKAFNTGNLKYHLYV